MKVLAFDPSMSLTGVGVVSDAGEKLVAGLIIRPDGADRDAKAAGLWHDAYEQLMIHQPDIIVVETPWMTGRHPASQGGEKRSALTLPSYGVAVGICYAAALAYRGGQIQGQITVVTRPADAWTRGYPPTKNDPDKTGRVALVENLYRLPPGSLGARTVAGNVADAILLARHVAAFGHVQASIKDLQ